jgi:hypothetical protein
MSFWVGWACGLGGGITGMFLFPWLAARREAAKAQR